MCSVNQCMWNCFTTSAAKSLNGVVPCIERHQISAKYPGKEVGWTLLAFLMSFKRARLKALAVICVLAPSTGLTKFCRHFTVLCTYTVDYRKSNELCSNKHAIHPSILLYRISKISHYAYSYTFVSWIVLDWWVDVSDKLNRYDIWHSVRVP